MADQEPSHPFIEDFEDISTYMYVEAANGAPLFLPPSTKQRDFFIIMDDDHWNDISMEAFFEPMNGDEIPLPPTDIYQEYTLAELFGDEEARATLSSDSDDEPQLENDFDWIFDDEEEQALTMGIQHLFAQDAALGALITEHSVSAPLYDTQKMTSFQRVTRPLLELISNPERKTTIYEALENLCHPDVVRPYSVRKTSYQQLMDIGVASRSEAMMILDLSKKFAEAGADNMKTLLSDNLLNDLSDEEIFYRLQGVDGLRAYMAFTIMLFGFEKSLNFWPTQTEFQVKYDAFNWRLQRWSWSDEAVDGLESWDPYKGLAAWIIWTHS